MNVLMLHNSYKIRGGEDESFESELRMLRDHGHSVDTIVASNDTLEQIGKVQVALNCLWSKTAYSQVEEKLSSRPYDVMHVQNFFPLLSPSVYAAAKKHRVPVVQTLRNYRLLCPNALLFRDGHVCEQCLGKTFKYPGVIHSCYRNSRVGTASVAAMTALHSMRGTWCRSVDLYVSLTHFARQKFIQAGFSPEKIVVKSNFVCPDPGIGSGEGGYVLFVGRLSPEKGVKTLLEAWDLVNRRGATLKIVGEGPLQELVQQYCNGSPSAQWLGPKSSDEVKTLMGDARMLVFASEWYETFGRVAIESFAKGTPVVASRLGAMEEIVEDTQTGLLFRAGDPHDLAQKIDNLFERSSQYSDMRCKARSAFEKHYTAGQNHQELIQIYRNAKKALIEKCGFVNANRLAT